MARRKYNYIINDKTSGLARKRITPTRVEDIPDISVDKGIYSSGTAYERGDRVVHNGLVWQALKNTNTVPDFDDNTWRYVSPLDPTSAELKYTVSGDVINGSGTAHLYVHVIISGFDVTKQMSGGLSIAEQSGAIEVTRPYSDQPWFFAIKPKGEIKSAEVCTVRVKHDSLDRSVTAVVLLIPNGATLTVEQLQQLRETAQGVGGDRIVAYLDKEIPVRAREQALTAANKRLEELLAELEALKKESQGTSAEAAAKIGEILKTIAEQQEQIDGEVSNWFYSGAPAADKQPESDWTTNAHKARHIGDTYTSTDKEGPHMGKSWRYTTKFEWQEIADTLVSQALSKAKEAQSTADGKSTTYLSKPIRYEKGDTWILESDMSVGGKSYKAGTLLFATADSEVFVGSHWQDKTRYIGAIEIAESERKSKEAWEQYANAQATNAGSAALKTAKEYAEAQDKLLKTQTDAYADGVLTKAEQNALTVAKTQANLAEEQAKAYADGRVTEAEQAAIDKAKQAYTDAVKKAKELDGEIQVGGRNLLPISGWEQRATNHRVWMKIPEDVRRRNNKLEVNIGYDVYFDNDRLDNQVKLTMYVTDTDDNYRDGARKTLFSTRKSNLAGKKWHHIWHTAKIVTEDKHTHIVGWLSDSGALNNIYPSEVKNAYIRVGNVDQGYTPAPEDVQADIDKVRNGVENANKASADLKTYVDGAFRDGVITQQEATQIKGYINVVNTEWSGVLARYDKLYNSSLANSADLLNAKVSCAGAVDNLTKYITSAIADGVATKAEVTEVDRRYSTYKDAYATLNKQLEIARQASIDNIQVGGRNLAVMSRMIPGYIYGESKKGNPGDKDYKVMLYKDFVYDPTYHEWDGAMPLTFKLKKGGVSVPIIHYHDKDKVFIGWSFDWSERPAGYTKTLTPPAKTAYIRIGFPCSNPVVKVERGNKATDWTPAPEDVQAEIDAINANPPQINDEGTWEVYVPSEGKYVDTKRTSKGDNGKAPIVRNGNWCEWDAAKGDYIDTGIKAIGKDGHSFTASLRIKGYLRNGVLGNYGVYPTFLYDGSDVTSVIRDNFVTRFNENTGKGWSNWDQRAGYEGLDLADTGYEGPGVDIEVKATYKGLTAVAHAFVPHIRDGEKGDTGTSTIYFGDRKWGSSIFNAYTKMGFSTTWINNLSLPAPKVGDTIWLSITNTETGKSGQLYLLVTQSSTTPTATVISLVMDGKDGAKGAKGDKGDGLDVKDTRNDNQPPKWYRENYKMTTVKEFKLQSAIGIPTGWRDGYYCTLETTSNWSNSSGGPVQQKVTLQNSTVLIRQGTKDDSAWEPWSNPEEELRQGLSNANTAIDALKKATKMVEESMITDNDIKWLLDAYNEGKTTVAGGLVLTKIIALSNQVDRITAYLSGYDGNNGDGKILRAGIKYSEPTSEPTEVVDKEYRVPWVQCLRVGWMRFAGASKADYKSKYPNGPDFDAIEKMTDHQYGAWVNERFDVDDPSTSGYLNLALHTATMDYYKDKPRNQGYLSAPKVSDWYVYYADVHTETTPQPIRDTGNENTHIKHDGSAKFGAWSIVREGIYNTPTGEQYAFRLDSDEGELSIRNHNYGSNQATVVSRKGVYSNRAENGFFPSTMGIRNGAAVIGSAQLQDNKNALRDQSYPIERDLKTEETAREDGGVPIFAGTVGTTGHYGESRYYRNFGGYFEHLYARGLHIATRTIWGTNNTVTLTPTDGRVLLIEPDNPYIKLPKADSVYPGWTVDVAWNNKRGRSIRVDSTDNTYIVRHRTTDASVTLTEATGTIRITRIRRNKRVGSNDIAWFIEYLGWLD